jgi:DNA polymerase
MVSQQQKKLEEIEDEIHSLDAGPLAVHRREEGFQAVPGEGNPRARVMLIGEAPGAEEAKTGRPFVGRAGRLLEEKLESIGLTREKVYITNILKDRPPGNRDPRVQEVERYAPYLDQQIAIVQPEVFVTLGRFAMNYLLDRYNLPQSGRRIGELQGQEISLQEDYGKATLIPLYHPAATFYNPALEEDLDQGFRVLSEKLVRSRD